MLIVGLRSLLSSPCKDCDDRRVGCHCRCCAYIEYRKRYDEKNKEIRLKSLFGSERGANIHKRYSARKQDKKATQRVISRENRLN